jgi:hypothetical protein
VGVKAFVDVATACRKTIKRLAPERADKKAHVSYTLPYQRFKALYPALKSLEKT